jgi:hypothetical protein
VTLGKSALAREAGNRRSPAYRLQSPAAIAPNPKSSRWISRKVCTIELAVQIAAIDCTVPITTTTAIVDAVTKKAE